MLKNKIKGSGSFFRDILRNFILLLLVPMITILVLFFHADRTVKEQVQESASQKLDLYYEQMEDIIKGMQATCLSILDNQYCQMYSRDWVNGSQQETIVRRNIFDFLGNLIDIRYRDIFIYYERNGRCVSGNHTSFSAERYYEAYYGELGKEGYLEEFLEVIQCKKRQLTSQMFRDYYGEEYLCMTIRVQNGKEESNGYTICIVLEPEYLDETILMRNMDKESLFLTYNTEQKMVLNNAPHRDSLNIEEDLLDKATERNIWLDREGYMVQLRDSEIVDNQYLYLVTYESFWDELQQLRLFCYCGIAVCMIFSALFAYRNAKRTYHPIEGVVEFIRGKEENRFVKAKGQKEFAYIMSYIDSNENKMREYKKVVQELRLYDLLQGKTVDIDTEELARHNISFPYGNYAVCLIMIEKNKDEITDWDHFVVKNVMEELGNANGRAYQIAINRNCCALLLNLDGDRTVIENIIKEGGEFLKQYFQMTLSIGFSNLHEDQVMIQEAYKEAQEALRYRFLNGRGCQIHYGDISDRKLHGQKGGESKLYLLILDYVKGEKDTCDAQKFVESLGDIYEVNGDVSVEMAYFYKNEVVTTLRKLMELLGYEEDFRKNMAKGLTETDTLVEFKERFSELITEMRAQCGKKKPKENICLKLKNYLEENYSDTELSVNVIGQRMGMQPAHLSKLFKETYGISIADYLAVVRIREAKRMLQEQDMSVQETAEKTGFISSHAFIRMFKKVEGMTPGNYAKLSKK